MTRECHVRFCESWRGKFPPSTRLDFSLLLNEEIKNQLESELLIDGFRQVALFVKEKTNMSLDIIDKSDSHNESLNFYLSYIGPLGGEGRNKMVKVDISKNENLQFQPQKKDLLKNYSDQQNSKILSYSLEEVLIEKMRTVMQRMQARDFYDIWYLLHVAELDVNSYVLEFKNKCMEKEIDPSNFLNKLDQRLPQYKARWQNSLKEQIQELPNFEQVERETLKYLRKLKL